MFTDSGKTWQMIADSDFSWRDVLVYFTIPLFFIISFAGILTFEPNENFFHLPANWLFFVNFSGAVAGIFIASYLVAAMAPRFKAVSSFPKTFALISFSYLPVLFASLISTVHEILQIINFIGLIYMVFLFWRGTGIVLGVPSYKQAGFSIIALLILFAARVVCASFFAAIALTITGGITDVLNS